MTDTDNGPEYHDPAIYGRDIEFSASMEIESEQPPRDIRKLLGVDETFDISSNLPGFEDGEYRWCEHCGDTIVEVDYYEDHLEEIHGLEP